MPSTRRRVVITGLGPLTAAGIGVSGLREGLRSLTSPVARVTRFDTSGFRTHVGAEIRDFEPTVYIHPKKAKRMGRFVHFSLASTHLAIADSGLDTQSVDPCRVAVQMGSAVGGLGYAEVQLRKYLEGGTRALNPHIATTVFAGAASCHTAIEYGFTGPNSTNAMSCAAGTMAIGEAFRLIRDGMADVALAGGADAPLVEVCFGAFANMRAMSKRNDDPQRACRPFDKDRDGFVMGEGACTFVLEEETHARARGAHVYAEVRGFAVNNDAFHMAAPQPEGARAGECISAALDSAGLAADDVDHVNAHASATPLNDSTETMAIRKALGAHADKVSVTGTKPYHGHALGASGAIETAIACLSIQDGWIPPTLNLEEPGERCDLDYVTGTGRNQRVRTLVTNSFGFGGINAVLVLTAPNAGA